MEHTNYCRQMVKQFTAQANITSVPQWMKNFKSHCIDLARASHKFILPDGGRLYDDPEYKALDDTTPLNLPFPLIAIEFTRSDSYVNSKTCFDGKVQPSKGLLFARERDDFIAITVVVFASHIGQWVPYPEVGIPRTGYLDRSQRQNGYVGFKLAQHQSDIYGVQIPASDYIDEVSALLCMLNILQCRNVHIEKSKISKTRKAMQTGKNGALPFDTYHILTIDAPGKAAGKGAATGGHRSPREHLRRGHIRRLADGRRIWVNATVVAAGRSAGVVTKDYAVRCAA
jgi:hypothetical protein